MLPNQGNTLIVAHDTGGAEAIASWLKAHSKGTYSYLLKGPAISVFKKLVDPSQILEEKSIKLEDYDCVLAGSSWGSELERTWLKMAKERGVYTISYLEHWTKYRSRFQLHGKTILPDEIWVGDKWALAIARQEFSEVGIRLVPNLFVEDSISEIRKATKTQEGDGKSYCHILYVTEPTTDVAKANTGHARGYGYDEFEALESFFRYVLKKDLKPIEIRVRPHPSESIEKYREVIAHWENRLPITLTAEGTSAEACVWADWIVGADSMLMAIGAMSGKRVCSFLPAGARRALSLPFQEIERISGEPETLEM